MRPPTPGKEIEGGLSRIYPETNRRIVRFSGYDDAPGHGAPPSLSFVKNLAGFKISKIRQRNVTCYRVESRGSDAENKLVTARTFMRFRGPQALTDMDEFRRRTQLLCTTAPCKFLATASEWSCFDLVRQTV